MPPRRPNGPHQEGHQPAEPTTEVSLRQAAASPGDDAVTEHQRALADAQEYARAQVLAALMPRLIAGDAILDEPSTPPALWGAGEYVAWSAGESLIIAGPDGVGKTTLGGQLFKARLGLGSGAVLGWPVQAGNRRVLYLMMDRPAQISRALARIFTEDDRDILKARLVLWQGPPPADLAREPYMLMRLCSAAGADTVIIDSLKDAALKLSDDETGSGWNRARQLVIANGIEIIELHHPRKEQADNKRPATLADLYGSRWISSGAGSVIMLWGKAGDPLVEFIHLKQPCAEIPPFMMHIDAQAGSVSAERGVDLVEQVRARGSNGMTVEVAARLLYGVDKPSRAVIEKARRRLNHATNTGVLYRRDGERGGGREREPSTWFVVSQQLSSGQSREAITGQSRR